MTVFRLITSALGILTYPVGTLAAVSAELCPRDVEAAGEDTGNWTLYDDWGQFLGCNEKPRLFQLTMPEMNGDAEPQALGAVSGILACTSFRGEMMPKLLIPWNDTLADEEMYLERLQVSWTVPSEDRIPGQAASALREMSAYISVNAVQEQDSSVSLFAHYGETAVGVYIGEQIDSAAAVYSALQEAIRLVKKQGIGRSLVLQYCNPGQPSTTIGISVDTSGGETGLASVQDAVSSWSRGNCAPALEISDSIPVSIWAARGADLGSETRSAGITKSSASAIRSASTSSQSSATETKSASTASRSSAITNESLTTTSAKLISGGESSAAAPTTEPSQTTNSISTASDPTAGTLRRREPPTRNSDGSCAFYYVNQGETCDSIAEAHDLEADDITKFNEGKTWGFKECQGMPYDIFICLSEGDPPLPPPVEGVQCGPQVPGTRQPTDGTPLAELNPCPLNVCCSQFGYCGTTDEFCEVTGDVPGVSGCLSNCERGITNNEETPSEFISIGYFEAWNANRNCLHMDVDEIDTSRFTHIHFAFGKITPDLEVDMGGDIAEQFEKFVQLKGVKRIVSFGGWADSTDPDKFWIWRDAVETQDNRIRLAENLVKLVEEYDLDGIDLDWEYPAAPDIPDIPEGRPIDGDNYYKLLALLRVTLPLGKSLSIAAPASYWYLKGIPIEDIAGVLDYIVYMTYDLHGQWDSGGEHAQSGCANGNCLRSHVNFTETIDALSMITRAGVPASQVIVGVTSYGRSFLMAEAGCTGPMCTFVGDRRNSPAKEGPCTGEGGYIANAEIDMIMETNSNVETWYDDATMTDYLVYDEVQWVGYMNEETKLARTLLYRALNFGGVVDWAIDLGSFSRDEYMSPGVFAEIAASGTCPWKFEDGFTCTHPAIVNATTTNKDERWEVLNAGCAWREMTRAWDNASTSASFSQWASDFYAGETLFECEHLNGCRGLLRCPTAEADDSGPAAQLILESFMKLNGVSSSSSAFLSVTVKQERDRRPHCWLQVKRMFLTADLALIRSSVTCGMHLTGLPTK